MTPISRTFVESTITDSLGIVTTTTSNNVDNAAAPIASSRILLPDGNTSITVPTGSRGVIITFNPECDSTKTIRGDEADTGIPVATTIAGGSNSGTFMLLFGASVAASFIINSASSPAGTDPGYTEFQFV